MEKPGHWYRFFMLMPALAWVLTIGWMSLLPGRELPEMTLFQADKLLHIGAYSALVYLLLRGLLDRYSVESGWKWHLIGVITFANAYGWLIEGIQHEFVEDRFFDIFDLLANAIGTILGAIGVASMIKINL